MMHGVPPARGGTMRSGGGGSGDSLHHVFGSWCASEFKQLGSSTVKGSRARDPRGSVSDGRLPLGSYRLRTAPICWQALQ